MDIAGCRAGEDRIGAVVLVERGEDDDLVARVDDGHQGGDHRLRGAAGDRHVLGGLRRNPGELGGARLDTEQFAVTARRRHYRLECLNELRIAEPGGDAEAGAEVVVPDPKDIHTGNRCYRF